MILELGVVPVVYLLHKRPFVLVAYGDVVSHPVGTAADVVIGVEGLGELLQEHPVPVVVRVAVDVAVALIGGYHVIREHRTEGVVVAVGLVHDVHYLTGRDEVRKLLRGVEAVLHGHAHLRAALEAGFGGYQNDAVGALGSEHRGGRGILQDRNGLYFVGIELAEGAFDAVHHHQRGRTVPAGHASHEDLGVVVARLAAALEGEHARKLAGDGVGDVGGAGIDESVGTHLGDGSDDGFLLLGAVADHDHVFQHEGVFGEGDEPFAALGERLLLLRIAYAGYYEHGPGGNRD